MARRLLLCEGVRPNFICRCRSLLLAGVVVGSLVPSLAAQQLPLVSQLVTEPVVETRRVVLHGNVHPLLRQAADLGPVDASLPAGRMMMVLRRSPEREAALRAAIEALHDRNSASFHKWMTPQQFGAQWGAADADIAAVTAWLQSHGFAVAGATAGKTTIEFSGTAGQIESAFHTTIHTYRVNGELHHANSADPEVPEALAPVIAGITALSDFHPRAQMRPGPRGIYNTGTHRIEPDARSGGKQDVQIESVLGAGGAFGVRPELTASGSYGEYLYVGPADAATIYNSPIPALNPAASGTAVDGTGAVIGIVGDSSISTAQIANYRTLFGLAASTITVILDGSTDPGENGDAVEAYLDTEIAGGIAPGAQVYFYEAADTTVNYGVDLASSRAVNDNLVDVLNLSFGECEAELGSGNAFYAGLWEQAAAQGISVTVSAGDAGSAACDDADTQSEAYYGLQVNGLASTPYDTAVGGTDFAALAGPDGSGADFTDYVSETSDPTTLRSALGAIPETPWNDAIASFPPTTIDSSIPYTVPYANIVAAGGGASGCLTGVSTQSGFSCTGSYAKPAWQSAPGVPADGVRDLPDVALFAANGLNYASWGVCTDQDQDAVGNPIEDCTLGSNGLASNEFYIYGVGGTSASAPAMAGILALARQQAGQRQGLANYTLYNLARTTPSIFRDVTEGNNSVPCASGSANCVTNGEGFNLLTGYDAGSGYDQSSGLGSMDVSALLANWTSVGLASSTTQLTLMPASIVHGQTVNAQVTVAASSGQVSSIPSGQVALNATANPPSLPIGFAIGNYPLTSDGTTGAVAINTLPGGSYQLVASYGGSDSVAQSSSAPVTVTVAPEPSSTLITLSAMNPATSQSAAATTLPYGYPSLIEALPYGNNSQTSGSTPVPDGIATGSVTFTENAQNLGSTPIGLQGYAATQGLLLPPGSYAVQASYSGDNSFNPSVGSYTLVVSKGVTAAAMTASQTSYTGQPINFTITVSTASLGVAPTGTVQLTYDSTVLGTAKLTGSDGSPTALATATATISTVNLPSGTVPLQAVYSGDDNYAGSTSGTIAITGKPAFTIDNIAISLPNDHTPGSAYLPVTSEGGYTGTVKLTCALVSANNAADPPQCEMDPASETLAANSQAQATILIFAKGAHPASGNSAGVSRSGGTVPKKGGQVSPMGLLLLLLGIPARRRGWKTLLPAFLLLAVFACVTACGGGGQKITAGQYQFMVTGVDSEDASTQAVATVSVQVY